jgi:hypothetical protein
MEAAPKVGEKVTRLRLYLMRAVYLLTFVGVGSQVWPAVIAPEKPWDPLPGVAMSFWAAYTVLMGLGIRYPLQMVPLLLLQLFYKSVWLLAVAPSLWSAGRHPEAGRSVEMRAGCGAPGSPLNGPAAAPRGRPRSGRAAEA